MENPSAGTGAQTETADRAPAAVRRVLWALMIAGVALIGLGAGLRMPGAAPLGTILLGAALAVTGAEMIRSRRYILYNSMGPASRQERYSGGAAVAWGVFTLIAGGGVALAGGVALTGLDGAVGRLILSRPSLALVPAGVAFAALAMAYLIGSDTWRDRSLLIQLGSLPHRLGGLILLLIALALLGLGGLDLLAPERFDRLIEGLK